MKYILTIPSPLRLVLLHAWIFAFLTTVVYAELPQPQDYNNRSITTISTSGSHNYWYSTFLRKSDLEEGDIQKLNLRMPADTLSGWVWVNRQIRAHSSIPSQPSAYTGPNEIQFYAEAPETKLKTNEEGEQFVVTKPSPLGSIPLNPNYSDLLIILNPSNNGGDKSVRGFSLNNDSEKYPKGSIRVLNVSDRPNLVIGIGNKAKKIPQGKMVAFNVDLKTNESTALRVADTDVSKESPIYSNMWTHLDDRRHLILISKKSRNREGIHLKAINGL